MLEPILGGDSAAVNPTPPSSVVALHPYAAAKAAVLKPKEPKAKGKKSSSQAPKSGQGEDVSVSKRFADALIRGYGGPWAAMKNGQGVVVYRWVGTHWSVVDQNEGKSFAARWLDRHRPDKAGAREAGEAWGYAWLRLADVRPMPEPTRRVIVPCADVYLEITPKGVIALEPDPSLGMTHCLALKAETPAGQIHRPRALAANSGFRSWLSFAQPEEAVRALVQEQCGMSLLPGRYQIAVWWWGDAGCGKSMLANLVASMQRQVTTARLHNLDSPFGLENLIGASLVRVDEVPPKRWCEETWKSLVSGDPVSVERKWVGGAVVLCSKAFWIICSNGAPFVTDPTDGVWRRLCVTRWGNPLPGEKQEESYHKTLLASEGRAILDWMLAGAVRIVRRGRFLPESQWPASMRREKGDTRANSDSVTAWIVTQNARPFDTSITAGEWKTKGSIYEDYEQFCAAAQRDVLRPEVFWRGVHQHPIFSGKLHFSNRRVQGKCVFHANIAFGDGESRAADVPLDRQTSLDFERVAPAQGGFDFPDTCEPIPF